MDGRVLFFLVFNRDRLQIFCFENLPAVETLNVIDAIAAGDHLRALVLTRGLHKKRTEIRNILMNLNGLSSARGEFLTSVRNLPVGGNPEVMGKGSCRAIGAAVRSRLRLTGGIDAVEWDLVNEVSMA